ncbi:transposase, OrfB [Ahrensia sp. R2A130]|nr:transposase, OrfB [Ahrensia sp. R2A130]
MRRRFEHKADDRMRYRASEKLEIIRLVEKSHLPTKQTIDRLGIPRTTFYRWYDKYLTGGAEALEDRSPKPLRAWNRIPDDVRKRIVDMALDEPELSPRELAVRFTDTQRYPRAGHLDQWRSCALDIRSQRLSIVEGARSHHQSGLRRYQGSR